MIRYLCLLFIIFGPGQSFSASPKTEIVASFSIIQNIAQKIAGDTFNVKTLVGAQQDAHVFQPKPHQIKLLAKSRLFILNGLQFDHWAERLATNKQFTAEVLVLGDSISPLRKGPQVDPHAWQNPLNGLVYAKTIKAKLDSIFPDKKEVFAKNLTEFEKNISALQKKNIELLRPFRGQKALVTHNAFGYFSQAYGVEFLSFYGLSTDSEVQPKKIRALLDSMKKEKIKVLFLENSKSDSSLKSLAGQANLIIGKPLYSDALSEADGPASDYYSFLRYNAATVAEAFEKASNLKP
jgi:zinc/manganese transport system substrate-binding protein